MASIKRPAVVFAAVFLFSALLCGFGYDIFCIAGAIILLPFTVYFGIFKKLYRRAFFVALLVFSLVYPSVFGVFTEHNQQKMYDELKDKHSFTATVNHISYGTKSVYIYADIYGSNGKTVGKAAFTKAFVDKMPDLYDTFYFEGDIHPINKDTVEKLSLFGNENYYFADKCYLAAETKELTVLGRLPKEKRNSVQNYYFYICDNLRNTVPTYNGTDPFAYIPALLAGNRALIPYEVTDAYTRSGLMPYLCISGLHVAIATGVLLWILNRFGANKYLKLAFVVLFLFFLCLVTGFSGSVIRASFMNAVVLFGDCLNRRTDRFTSLAIALCVVLTYNPYSVFDLGTQLSFIAMLGLCNSAFVASAFKLKNKALSKLRGITVTCIITSGYVIVPILYSFGGAFLLTPIAALPAMIFTPIMYLLVIMAIFAFMPQWFLCIFGYPASLLTVFFERLAITFSKIPYAYAEFSCPLTFYIMFLILMSFNIFCIAFKNERYITFSGVMLAVFAYFNTFLMHILTVFFG